jgi:hypothetical protein
MDLRKIGLGSMCWINLTLGRGQRRAFVNAVNNFQAPKNVGKLLSSKVTGDLCRRTLLSEVSQ